MKICQVGQIKHKFVLTVNTDEDEVIDIKERIHNKLGVKNVGNMRLFSLKNGIELMDADHMQSVHGLEYLYYSFGEDFDYEVRMEFIQLKHKLGQGGYGSVYLAFDSLLK